MNSMIKQKVLIVHNYYQVPGGEDTVVENERKLLLDNDHEVILYTRHNDEIKYKGIIGKLLLPLETIFSLKTYREVKKIIKKEKIEIVHVHNTLPLVSPSVYYAARYYKVPVVQTIHNFRMLCPGATFTRDNKICEDCVEKSLICAVKNKCYRGSQVQSFVSAFNLGFHRFIGTYKKVDGYIALTEFNKNKMTKLINKNKIHVKPNFVYNEKNDLNRKCGEYFLYFGRIDKIKGIEFLLNSWIELKGEKLIICGTGPYEKEAQEFIKTENMKNVTMVGYKTKEELQLLIRSCKAVIIPSQWYEPFGMVAVETFEMSKPVIAGDIGALSSIVSNNYNGILFKYNDKSDFINKINTLKSYKLLDKLSEGARESYINNYDENRNYDILYNIYKKIT